MWGPNSDRSASWFSPTAAVWTNHIVLGFWFCFPLCLRDPVGPGLGVLPHFRSDGFSLEPFDVLLNVPIVSSVQTAYIPRHPSFTRTCMNHVSVNVLDFLLSFILTSHILFQQHLMLHFFFFFQNPCLTSYVLPTLPLPPFHCMCLCMFLWLSLCTCVHATPYPTQLPPPMLLRRSRGGGSPPAQTNSSLSLKAMSWRRQATESRRGLQVNETRRESVRGGDG